MARRIFSLGILALSLPALATEPLLRVILLKLDVKPRAIFTQAEAKRLFLDNRGNIIREVQKRTQFFAVRVPATRALVKEFNKQTGATLYNERMVKDVSLMLKAPQIDFLFEHAKFSGPAKYFYQYKPRNPPYFYIEVPVVLKGSETLKTEEVVTYKMPFETLQDDSPKASKVVFIIDAKGSIFLSSEGLFQSDFKEFYFQDEK